MGLGHEAVAGRGAHHASMERTIKNTDALRVDLQGPNGETWSAIGGGDTLADALEFAVASAPTDTRWRVTGWSRVYGD